MMKNLFKISFILLILIFASGCAYYNTFFNAKKYFSEAEKEREKRLEQQKKQLQKQQTTRNQRDRSNRPSTKELEGYNKSIKKASKVLELHGKSKYVDDALFLLGKCFFRKKEYQKAERKFIELYEHFPDSKFIPESRLWLGKTYIEMKRYEEAEITFQDILNSNVNEDVHDETRLLLGGLFKHKEDYIRAVSQYETAAKRANDRTVRAQSYFEMGESYFAIKNYEKAVESFLLARKYSPDDKFEFNTMFQAGLTYIQMEKYEDAIDIFQKLLGDVVNEENWPGCRLQIAYCYRASGNPDLAIEYYQEIIDAHPKTVEAADAYYYLGKIYLETKGEYEFALEYFDKAPTENARSSKANDARAMSKSIQRLMALREDIVQQQRRIAAGDSIAAAIEDSLDFTTFEEDTFRIGFIDSMFADTTKFKLDSLDLFDDSLRVELRDSIRYALENEDDIDLRKRILTRFEIAIRRSRNRDSYQGFEEEQQNQPNKPKVAIKSGELGTPHEELVKDRLLLAEIYLFEFDQPEAAMGEYLKILEIDTTEKVIPKVLYSIGYIAENFEQDTVLADSMFQCLIADYPDSPFSLHARKKIKTIDIPDLETEIANKFKLAETVYSSNHDYESAIEAFELILAEYPSSDFAPKSLMTMGWIYESELDQPEEAFSIYQTLVDKYPNSNYAKKIRKKVDAVIKSRSSSTEPGQEEQPTEIKQVEVDEIDQEQLDQTGELDVSSMDKEQYRRYLQTEMQKNDPRRKTPRRW